MTETATIIAQPGIYFDVPFEDYVKIPAINNSTLKVLREHTPMHARYYQQHGFDTKALDFGRLTHVMLLEPDKFDAAYAVGPNVRGNTNKWKDFASKAREQNKEPIKRAEYDEAMAFKRAVLNQPVARFVSRGRAEVTLVWLDDEPMDIDVYTPTGEQITMRHYEPTGLLQKARVDYAHEAEAILCDVKGVVDASPNERGFPRAAANFAYHQQAAMSSHGWEKLTDRTPAFTFVVIEKCPAKADPMLWPFPSAAYETQPLTLNAGMLAYRDSLKTWAECLKKDEWPGYMTEKVLPLEIPGWALAQAGAVL